MCELFLCFPVEGVVIGVVSVTVIHMVTMTEVEATIEVHHHLVTAVHLRWKEWKETGQYWIKQHTLKQFKNYQENIFSKWTLWNEFVTMSVNDKCVSGMSLKEVERGLQVMLMLQLKQGNIIH